MVSEFEFKIDGGWTPTTIPQARLGEYLVEVAKLCGEADSVHFDGMRKGSVVLVSKVEGPATPKVQRRLMEVSRGHAAKDVIDAYRRLDDMLADDNAVGLLRSKDDDGSIVIRFPGRKRDRPVEYIGIKEDGFLEGELIRLEGRDKTIHAALRSGETVYSAIETDRDMARRLGPLIFGPTIRLSGTGTWERTHQGVWSLTRFVVSSFVEIADVPLADAVDGLRAIGGSRWHLDDDPMAALREIRLSGGAPA